MMGDADDVDAAAGHCFAGDAGEFKDGDADDVDNGLIMANHWLRCNPWSPDRPDHTRKNKLTQAQNALVTFALRSPCNRRKGDRGDDQHARAGASCNPAAVPPERHGRGHQGEQVRLLQERDRAGERARSGPGRYAKGLVSPSRLALLLLL